MKREDAGPEVARLFALMETMGNPPPNMHLTIAKNPELYAKWFPFATYIIPASPMAPRHRQILILRSAYNWRCGYAWSQHVRISKRLAVLADDEIKALEGGCEFDWTATEAALVAACDESAASMEIGDRTWAVLSAGHSERELTDIVFTIGQYALIAIALKSLKVQLDEGLSLPAWARHT